MIPFELVRDLMYLNMGTTALKNQRSGISGQREALQLQRDAVAGQERVAAGQDKLLQSQSELLASQEKIRGQIEANLVVLSRANDTLTAVSGQLLEIKAQAREAAEIQRVMLQRDIFQDAVEEFIFRMQRSIRVMEQEGADTHFPKVARYYFLLRLLDGLKQHGFDTPLIRGIQNKVLFDECRSHSVRLLRNLTDDPDVCGHLEEQKQKRELEEQERKRKRELEEQRWKWLLEEQKPDKAAEAAAAARNKGKPFSG